MATSRLFGHSELDAPRRGDIWLKARNADLVLDAVPSESRSWPHVWRCQIVHLGPHDMHSSSDRLGPGLVASAHSHLDPGDELRWYWLGRDGWDPRTADPCDCPDCVAERGER